MRIGDVRNELIEKGTTLGGRGTDRTFPSAAHIENPLGVVDTFVQ